MDVLSQDFFNMFVMSSRVFSKCERFVTFLDICDVLLPAQRNVDILSQDFFDTFAMSSRLFSEMWTFCHMISGNICDVQAAVKRNVDVLSQDLCKNTDGAFRIKKIVKNLMRQSLLITCGLLHVLAELQFIIKLIHGPLRISCHM